MEYYNPNETEIIQFKALLDNVYGPDDMFPPDTSQPAYIENSQPPLQPNQRMLAVNGLQKVVLTLV